MRRRAIVGAVCITAHWAPIAAAQVAVSGDVGVARLRQAGQTEATLATVSGGLARADDRANATYSIDGWGGLAADGTRTARIVALASAVSESYGRSLTEITMLGTLHSGLREAAATSVQLWVRQHRRSGRNTTFFGGGAGHRRWHGMAGPFASAQAGWSNTRGRDQRSLTAAFALVTEPEPLAAGFVTEAEYVDVSASWRRTFATTMASVDVGYRHGFAVVSRPAIFGGVTVIRRFGDHRSITLSVGQTPIELLRGIPASRYALVALRWERQHGAATRPRSERQ